jgi:hypothetical protein
MADPVGSTGGKKSPVKKAPVKKAPVKKAPVKKAPVKKGKGKGKGGTGPGSGTGSGTGTGGTGTGTGPAPTPGQPAFGQPLPGPDPSSFKVPHPSDDGLYKLVNDKLVQPFPAPATTTTGSPAEPVVTFEEVWGPTGAAKAVAISQAGQMVFHSVGDTGSVVGPRSEELVADKMVADFLEPDAANVPSFFFHLGDVVYSFGEAKYYYDQFYEPWRGYQAPILAVAGNHDGVVYTGDPATSLAAWLRNFCATSPISSPDSAGLIRTAMIQPGVFYTFDAPFVRILALYSNVLEDPGVISTEGGTRPTLNDTQIDFLTAALTRCKTEKYAGAVLIAVHHPPYTAGLSHGGSPLELADMDAACTTAGFWPHAVFSGHAHNYQRFTRTVGPGTTNLTIPYIVAGNGGHSIDPLRPVNGQTIRTPLVVDDTLTLENYDDTNYGYLRLIVTATTLTVEYHAANDTQTKSPNDTVTVTLATHAVS